MSTSDSTIKGKFDEVAGKIKQSVGESFNDQSLANKGAAQQIKGHAEQAWGSVKEAARDTRDRNEPEAELTAHDVRENLASAARDLKENIQNAVDKHRNP